MPIHVSLIGIDNAREQVDKNGRIRGILAANNPLGIVRGVWYRPSLQLMLRAPGGLGATGIAVSKLALGPAGSAGLFGAKLLLTRLPEPEIDLPVGTEMILRIDSETDPEFWTEIPLPNYPDVEFAGSLGHRPFVIRRPNGDSVPDVINLALSGSEDLVRRSFLSAGWSDAEPLNRRSFGRAYKAFTQRSGYREAPVSMLLYQGRPPDLVFQKSLNSIAKRHHVRLWRIAQDGEEAWFGAASHDISVTFDRKTFSLSHRIDSDLDAERQKIIGDLVFVESIAGVSYVPRTVDPNVLGRTDGQLAVAQLRGTCGTFSLRAMPEINSRLPCSGEWFAGLCSKLANTSCGKTSTISVTYPCARCWKSGHPIRKNVQKMLNWPCAPRVSFDAQNARGLARNGAHYLRDERQRTIPSSDLRVPGDVMAFKATLILEPHSDESCTAVLLRTDTRSFVATCRFP